MREFRELDWSGGTETVLRRLSRLTAMRGVLKKEPMRQLLSMCAAVIDGNIRLASDSLFAMTGALVAGNYRRVTGDLFKDFILHEIFLEPHPFALMAAANRLDEALYRAMKEDLDALASFRDLDGETLFRYIRERYAELRKKEHPNPDLAERRAVAAWGGSVVRPPDEAMTPLPKLPTYISSDAPEWHYGEEEMRDSYVSDEALEEMYHRFIESGMDWSSLNEDLWNFFAAYGSGDFLRVRRFVFAGGTLAPIEDTRLPREGEFSDSEYRSVLARVIDFMRGDDPDPFFKTGQNGVATLFAVTDDLPELRLVYVPGTVDAGELIPLVAALRDQPLKFAVAFADAASCCLPERLVPANVLMAVPGEGEEW